MLNEVPKLLLFDVFGTVFDWRRSVSSFLKEAFDRKAASLPAHPTSVSEIHSSEEFWNDFSQQWRDSYKTFVQSYEFRYQNKGDHSTTLAKVEDHFITVDEHHFDSLISLLNANGLNNFFTNDEVYQISRIWHSLKPWEDSVAGMRALRQISMVSTLSNGNMSLLTDMSKNSGVEFDVILSAELFRAYKPKPCVYIGACEILGFGQTLPATVMESKTRGHNDDVDFDIEAWKLGERGKVALVAAHIHDLDAARKCGLRTIFIERPGEDVEAVKSYKEQAESWIDLWVSQQEGGLGEIANRLRVFSSIESVTLSAQHSQIS